MSDGPKVLKFPSTIGGQPAPPPAGPVRKLGLFPLGTEDVVMSTALLELILTMLERGTAAERLVMAQQIKDAFKASFVP